jgi:hypothetical protein
MTLFEKIKEADKPKLTPIPIEVPEWGLTVYIKQQTVGDRDAFETEAYNARQKGQALIDNPRSRFLCRVLCDETGKPLVGPGEFEKLAQLSIAPMQRLFDAAQKFNKLTDDDIEDLGKN